MEKRTITLGDKLIEITHFSEPMDIEFSNLFHIGILGGVLNQSKFKEEAFNVFDNYNEYKHHDAFFNNFAQLWMYYHTEGRFWDAENVWKLALEITQEWEIKNPKKRIHKGTPYYFLSVTNITKGDLEKGFLTMHQGLKEDQDSWDQKDPPTYFSI